MSPEAKKPKPPSCMTPSQLQVYTEVYTDILGKAGVSSEDINRLKKDALTTRDAKTQEDFARTVDQVSSGIIFQEKP